MLDYGKKRNQEKYGTATAPLIPLSNIKIPTALFVGTSDLLATEIDAKTTMS